VGRRVLCAACDGPIDVDVVTTLKVVLQAPVSGGIPAPPIKAEVDLCSAQCIQDYLLQGILLEDLMKSLAKWNAVVPTRRPSSAAQKRSYQDTNSQTSPTLLEQNIPRKEDEP
jgi:hypothetical protein